MNKPSNLKNTSPRKPLPAYLFILTTSCYIIAHCLPAVKINTSFGGAWYNPESTRSISGIMCTMFHPAGWGALLVMTLGILFFLLLWLRRKRLLRGFLTLPVGVFFYSIYTSYEILHINPAHQLLVGHYLWMFSLFVAIPYYWSLGIQSTEET